MRRTSFVLALILAGATSVSAQGSVFVTGHDPDFHAQSASPENWAGARRINNVAISYVMNPTYNPFLAGGASKFLFVESKSFVPGGHRRGRDGIVASGYTEGVHFDWHASTTLSSALDQLGTVYSAIVIASDFGGTLRAAELSILNARSSDIIAFINAGGGLYAMSQSNGGAGLTGSERKFGFLPFLVTSAAHHAAETANTVTPFGASLGLTTADVNGNFSHNIFTATGGMNVVDHDAHGNILSLAARTTFTEAGVVPEPSTLFLLGGGLAGLAFVARKRRQ
jgi:hypothetical protein